MPLFDASDVDEFAEGLQNRIEAPIVYVKKSTLGGQARPSLFLTVSLDPRETWANGILQNSRYFTLYLHMDGEIGLTVDSGRKGRPSMMAHTQLAKRWRKTKAQDFTEAIRKINKYIREVY